MVVGIAGAAYHASKVQQADLLNALREAVAGGLDRASSEQTRVAGDIRAFIEWLNDRRPEFADELDGEDKFADLIELARNYQDCTSFFVSEVGVNTSTVWRWATGKSRPSRYIGKRLTAEVKERLTLVLWQLAWEVGLVKSPTEANSSS